MEKPFGQLCMLICLYETLISSFIQIVAEFHKINGFPKIVGLIDKKIFVLLL